MYGEMRHGCIWVLLMGVFGWALVLGLVWFLTGCTATTTERELALAGYLCQATKRESVTAASGQAALEVDRKRLR